MAEIWKPVSRETIQHWIDTILNEAQDKLNSWELKFVSDMENKIYNSWSWTEAQERKLEQIYAEKTN